MKKLLLSATLMLLASAYALCQVTISFKVETKTNYELKVPQGNGSTSFDIVLSKPNSQVVNGGPLYIYLKKATGTDVLLYTLPYVASTDWGVGSPNRVDRGGTHSLVPSQLNEVSGKLYVQFDEGVTYKSNEVTITLPIYVNMLTPPATVDFVGSGDPGVIIGSVPKGGNGTYAYQWQSSTTSLTAGFSNIPSATGKDYDPPLSSVIATTFYRRVATSDGLTSNSDAVRVTIAPLPISNNVMTASGATSFVETGDPAIINGNVPSGGTGGSYTYQWESSTLVNPSNFTVTFTVDW